jgi:hypothetical protein
VEGHLVVVREAACLAKAALCVVEQRAHRRLPSRRRGELGRVQVEVQAEDDRAV